MAVLRVLGGVSCLFQLALALDPALWTIHNFRTQEPSLGEVHQAGGAPDPKTLYPAHTLDVPIDHFHNDSSYEPHTNDTFPLRYWFDARFYKHGGPVFVLQGGETSGEDRLPFLQKGIVAQLSEATHGLGVILEHRYYGRSFPVANLSTQSLRFLTTDQALADMAYFAKNIQFPGLEDKDITSRTSPYIAYGGSYAGAFVAFLRKLYPDVYWGAISSSGVTQAIYEFWEYFEAARLFSPAGCSETTQKLTHIVDNILLGTDDIGKKELKRAFGLKNLTHDVDFAFLLSQGISGLQSTNWDPEVSRRRFSFYCTNLTSTELLYPEVAKLNSTVRELIIAGGYKKEVDSLAIPMLNYVGFVNATAVARCNRTHDECFGNFNETFYQQDDISQEWRAWPYQTCTQWGYYITGTGVPDDQLPLISRALEMEYVSIFCKLAFNITTPPDVESINKHGGFNFSYPRVALIDGQVDPWRAATPHKIGFPDRISTVNEPFLLIQGGVHHWDENGRFKNETTSLLPPEPVRTVQRQEVEFVKEWLKEWAREGGSFIPDEL